MGLAVKKPGYKQAGLKGRLFRELGRLDTDSRKKQSLSHSESKLAFVYSIWSIRDKLIMAFRSKHILERLLMLSMSTSKAQLWLASIDLIINNP